MTTLVVLALFAALVAAVACRPHLTTVGAGVDTGRYDTSATRLQRLWWPQITTRPG